VGWVMDLIDNIEKMAEIKVVIRNFGSLCSQILEGI